MIHPKKSLGQHFLNDLNIVKKIIQAAKIRPDDEILEIGPGKGILTRQLVSCSKKVVAVEIDRELVSYLRNELGRISNLEIIQGDILRIDFSRLPSRFKVVANIPYQISSPLLDLLIQQRKRISTMTLMVQKEVAERIVAGPGSKNYSPLSIFIQFYASATIEFHIKKAAFSPPPKVDSSVVMISPNPFPRIRLINDRGFFKLVRGAFAHRRKSIRNSLKDEGFSANQIDAVFKELSLDSTRRGETFTIEEYGSLSNQFFADSPAASIPP